MKTTRKATCSLFTGLALLTLASSVQAYSSGSTGADGPLTPAVNTEVTLPPSGVLNYSLVNIPVNVTVTFRKNATNTPVVLLVQGDVTIAGRIDVSGKKGADVGGAGDGIVADDGMPGEGGPGGYSGGAGGRVGADRSGGSGRGPGGGLAGLMFGATPVGGGGAGYVADGTNAFRTGSQTNNGNGGKAYGSANILPLIGGSGGGGGVGGTSQPGTGGGGGGGALLIAASGTVTITSASGSILASGGNGGSVPFNTGGGATGGGGSGGAIRIIASTITGNGTINAAKGVKGTGGIDDGGDASDGRVRLEADINTRTQASVPTHTASAPGSAFIAGLPTLKIKTVGTETVPAAPTGVADVSLPTNVVNPVPVTFETTNVPQGTVVKVTVAPAYGANSTATSNALTGSDALATASASVTLPQGASTLFATLTYNVIASAGDLMSKYAQGERVEQVRLSASMGKPSSTVTLITGSGREYEVPAVLLAGI
jgi:hypothetical protein